MRNGQVPKRRGLCLITTNTTNDCTFRTKVQYKSVASKEGNYAVTKGDDWDYKENCCRSLLHTQSQQRGGRAR